MRIQIKEEVKTKKLNRHWEYCVGSGHAALALRHDYVKQLKYVSEQLGFKYVRFHGIFNDDMHTLDDFSVIFDVMPNAEKFIEQSFFNCGIAYDNVLECGLKPFIELSFMPEMLAKEKTKSKNFYGTNFNNPSNLDKWAKYIHDFVEFLIHRYGEDEVATWPFEVWNEPDLKGAFYNGTQEEYFELYAATAKAIKSVSQRIRVGGPATSGSRWVKSFVDYCNKFEIPFDFVSTHQYAGDPYNGIEDEGVNVEKTKNVDKSEMLRKMLERIDYEDIKDLTFLEIVRRLFGDPSQSKEMNRDVFYQNAKLAKSYCQDYPLYYTEWNFLATFSAYSNDTKKVPAYLLKTCMDIADYVEGSSVWCFSDLFEEMHQFKEEFHGGFGLMTIHGIPKPSFYGMAMLQKLSDERIMIESEYGDLTMYAFKSKNSKEALVMRQAMKAVNLDKEKVTLEFESQQAPLQVIINRIDDEHCNPLAIFERMGSPKELNKDEVAAIIEQSKMIDEVIPFEYQENKVIVDIELAINDSYLVKLVF